MALHMHVGRVAGLKDFPHHLQTGLQWDPSSHDDVINVRPGQRGPHIFQARPSKKLEIGVCDLLLHVGEDAVQDSQQEDLLAHASSLLLHGWSWRCCAWVPPFSFWLDFLSSVRTGVDALMPPPRFCSPFPCPPGLAPSHAVIGELRWACLGSVRLVK